MSASAAAGSPFLDPLAVASGVIARQAAHAQTQGGGGEQFEKRYVQPLLTLACQIAEKSVEHAPRAVESSGASAA